MSFNRRRTLRFVPVQHVPFRDGKRPREQHTEQPGHHDVGVHGGVGGRAGVLGEQDARADARAAADQFGDDVHDQRDRDRHAQARGDERGRARHDDQRELARASQPQH
jgi:hypothetical protein